MSTRKFLGAVAAVVLVAGYPINAVADSAKTSAETGAKTSVKGTTPLDAKAFFLQVRPIRPGAYVTSVAELSVARYEVLRPLIVLGVAF